MFSLLTSPIECIKAESVVYLSEKLNDWNVDVMIINNLEDKTKKVVFQKNIDYQIRPDGFGACYIRIAGSTKANPIPLRVHFSEVTPAWLDDLVEQKI